MEELSLADLEKCATDYMSKISEKPLKIHPIETSRKNNFNFLRLMFASLVILSHSFELVDGNRSRELLTTFFGTISFGEFAVDGFFLLSGYLIVKSWDSEAKIFSFLSKRILRIYPGFIVAALVCAFVVGPLGAESASYFSQLELNKLSLSILKLHEPAVPAVFVGQPHAAINSSMWTISYEFLCYFSVLVLGMIGLIKRRSAMLFITASFFAIVLYQKLGFRISLFDHSYSLQNPFFRLGMFFFSGGAYYLFRDKVSFRPLIAWTSGGILIFAMFQMPFAELALASMGGYLLFYLAFSPIRLLRPFQTLPDVSYGLYLYGWPIQMLLIWYFPVLPAWWVFFLSLGAGVCAGFLSWHLVEKPLLKFKPKSSKLAMANSVIAVPVHSRA